MQWPLPQGQLAKSAMRVSAEITSSHTDMQHVSKEAKEQQPDGQRAPPLSGFLGLPKPQAPLKGTCSAVQSRMADPAPATTVMEVCLVCQARSMNLTASFDPSLSCADHWLQLLLGRAERYACCVHVRMLFVLKAHACTATVTMLVQSSILLVRLAVQTLGTGKRGTPGDAGSGPVCP